MKHQDYKATAGLITAALKIAVVVAVPITVIAFILKLLGVL